MIEQTYLYREIEQQPAVMQTFLEQEMDQVKALAHAMIDRKIDHVIIAARGTSDNAGRYAKYVLGGMNGLQVALATPSLFSIYDRPIQFGRALVLGISQSGQSPDIVAVLAAARAQGKLTAAITNTPDSPLAAQADIVISLHAGPEKAVAATKSYTSSLMAIAALSCFLKEDSRLDELHQVPSAMAETLQLGEAAAALAPRYRYMQHCVVIGRVFNYGTAFELALKLKELTYTVVESYSSADFLHGPFAILDHGFPVILLAPQGTITNDLIDFANRVRGRGAELIAITDNDSIAQIANFCLRLPVTVPDWLSPLTTIIPGQQLALHLAATRGHDVDSPRALSKVTETH